VDSSAFQARTGGGGTPTTTTFYRRGTTTPSVPTQTTGTPSGWSTTNPGATETENVYQITRTGTTYGAITIASRKTGGGGTEVSVVASGSYSSSTQTVSITVTARNQVLNVYVVSAFTRFRYRTNKWTEWKRVQRSRFGQESSRTTTIVTDHVSNFPSGLRYECQYQGIIKPTNPLDPNYNVNIRSSVNSFFFTKS